MSFMFVAIDSATSETTFSVVIKNNCIELWRCEVFSVIELLPKRKITLLFVIAFRFSEIIFQK